MNRDDEEEERKRVERERGKQRAVDRLHGVPPRITKGGFIDGRAKKRTGRVIAILVRVQPRVKAMLDHLLERDQVPSMVSLLEEMLEAYCEKYGAIDRSVLPSDDELLRRLEKERDDDDAK